MMLQSDTVYPQRPQWRPNVVLSRHRRVSSVDALVKPARAVDNEEGDATARSPVHHVHRMACAAHATLESRLGLDGKRACELIGV
jgi:hypothetical protein